MGLFAANKENKKTISLYGSITITVLLFCTSFYAPEAAEAQNTKKNHIGITLSKSCLTMLQNNVATICPTYEEIQAVHPDNSNKKISGDFIHKDGIWQRENPLYRNHFEYYAYDFGNDDGDDNNNNYIWIDPPGDIRSRIDLITISPILPEYKLDDGLSNRIENHTQVLGHSRYVTPNCGESTITAEDWIFLLGDTIRYMNHDCDEEFTTFDHIKKTYLNKTDFDIKTTYKYKLEKWIEESKEKCKTLCFTY